MATLWLDIETLPGETPPPLESIQAPGNYTKPETILKYQQDHQDKAWRAQALDPMLGRIACIAWAEGNAPSVCRGIWEKSEWHILKELDEVAQNIAGKDNKVHWGGFNLKIFDLQWIWIRAVKYGFACLIDFISRDRYPKNILDVRDLWTGNDSRGTGKLKDIIRFFNVTVPGFETVEDVEGDQVFDLYQAGEYEKIALYCRADVERTRAIAWKMGAGNPPMDLRRSW